VGLPTRQEIEMFNKKVLCCVGLCLMALIVAGCLSKNTSGKTVIKYVIWGTPDDLKIFNKLIDVFEQKNPDIEVKLINIPGDYYTKLQTMIAGGDTPDIFFMHSFFLPAYVEKNTVLDLQEFIDTDPEMKQIVADTYPQVLDYYKYKGHFYGYPRCINPFVIFYNKDMFDKAGVKYPDYTWNWDKFVASCQKLTKGDYKSGNKQFAFVFGHGFGSWCIWAWQNNGDLFDKTGTKSTMNTPEVVETLQWLYDLMNKHKVAPTYTENVDMGNEQMFMSGRSAMYVSGFWMSSTFQAITKFKWDVGPLPKGKVRKTMLANAGWCVGKDTKHLKETLAFLKFCAGKEGQAIVSKGGHDVPILKSVAESDAFLVPGTLPENKKVFLEEIKYSRFFPAPIKFREIMDTVDKDLDKVFRGMQPIKQTVAELDIKVNKLLSEK
jgi:multiple sugar transport system substrate-binding protein